MDYWNSKLYCMISVNMISFMRKKIYILIAVDTVYDSFLKKINFIKNKINHS